MKFRCFCILILFFFLTSCGNKREIAKKYYPNGKLQIEVEFKNGEKDGKRVEYFEDADTMYISYWEKDVKVGKAIRYFGQGKVESIVNWKNDLQDGESRFYYKNGNLQSISYWTNGKENGTSTVYYENGQIDAILNKRNGFYNGLSKLYYENGQLEKESFYIDSVRSGKETRYFDNGNIKSVEYFINWQGSELYEGGIEYTIDGSVLKETIRVEIDLDKDSVLLGEEIKAKIVLKRPIANLSKLVIGDYSDKFKLKDSISIKEVSMNNFETTYTFKSPQKGQQYLRGYVINYEIIDEKDNITRESRTYFEYPYFVK